jgi:hypothetical protein
MKRSTTETPRDDAGPTTTITRYQLLANDVLETLRAMMAEVPRLRPNEIRSKAFVRTHIGIPRPFVRGVRTGVETFTELDQLNQMNVGAAYGADQLRDAFGTVVTGLLTAAGELQLLIDTRDANTAAEALKIYAIARQLAKRSGNLLLQKFVRNMKDELARRRKPRKRSSKKGAAGAAAADTPPPAPAKKPRKPQYRTLEKKLERRVKGEEGGGE